MTKTYHQMTFQCSRDVATPLAAFLEDSSALSVSLIDAADEPIYEPELNEIALWSEVKVIALFDNAEEAHQTLQLLEQLLEYTPDYKIEIIDDQDWVSATQAQFQPQCFAEKLWVYPEWRHIPDSHSMALKLAPGVAFGTGTHATTQMCLEALARCVEPNMKVIDYGCGSGILGLAALTLGAAHSYCVDIDPQALEATQNNALLNQFDEAKLFIGLANEMPMIKVDILVANILAKPLIELQLLFEQLLKPKGIIILSGILDTQADFLIEAYKNWMPLKVFMQKEEWVSLIGGSYD